jgi:protein SCO1/2
MLKKVIRFLLPGLVVLAGVGCGPHQFSGAILDPPKPAQDFSLPSTDGSTFTLSDYQGQIVMVYFGYTFCPDVCPTTMYQVSRMMELLGSKADDVQVVMVTVDPERDTIEQLGRYVKNFDETFIGLRTTDLDQLDTIMADFGATYQIEEEDSAGGYLISHTAAIFVLDREGRTREIIPYGTQAEEMADDLRQLLKE